MTPVQSPPIYQLLGLLYPSFAHVYGVVSWHLYHFLQRPRMLPVLFAGDPQRLMRNVCLLKR